MSCNKSKDYWRLDSEYSEYLTITAPNYKAKMGHNSADTVDALRIYKVDQKHNDMYSLSELFTKELVYESKDKKVIREFLLAGQEVIMHLDCKRDQDEETFHIIALDNTFMRTGYFLVNVCNVNGAKYAIIHPLQKGGGSSIYYNKALIPIFEDQLHLISKTNKSYGK